MQNQHHNFHLYFNTMVKRIHIFFFIKWNCLKVKLRHMANSSLNLVEKKFYKVHCRLRTTMFVLSFPYFKSCALFHDPSDDRMMPCAEVQVTAWASQGNVTDLSHLNKLLLSSFLQLKGNIVDCQNNSTYCDWELL